MLSELNLNKILWTDEKTGYLCYLWRHSHDQTLHGYVGIPHEHPYAEISYHDIHLVSDKLNFAGYIEGLSENYWIGFDCSLVSDSEEPFDEEKGSQKIWSLFEQCQQLALWLFEVRFARKYPRRIFSVKIPCTNKVLGVFRDSEGLIILTANRASVSQTKFYDSTDGEDEKSVLDYDDPSGGG